MRRACIAIGVDNVLRAPNLPPLAAAADGAERFARWANSQRFETFCFTDRAGVLSVSPVKQRIRAIVNSSSYGQVVIYFAGHGILKSWDTEIWLLTDAATDPNEAVNLAGSVSLARQSGIPHVIFISDACRSIASDGRLAQISGSILFPILPVTPQRPEIDSFYASLPGDPSYEIPATQSAAKYRGVFTTCLLNGLSGYDRSVCEIVDVQNEQLCVVSSRTLKSWLEREVPQALQVVSVALNQIPELRVESQRPKYLAVVPTPPLPLPLFFDPPPPAAQSSSDGTLGSLARQHDLGEFFVPQREIPSAAPPAEDALRTAFNADMQRLEAVQSLQFFETHTGFTVVGTKILDAALEGVLNGCDVFENNGAMHVRVRMDGSSGSIVLRFENGNGTCLTALPGYIGAVTVEDGRVVNVSYTPARNSSRWTDYMYQQSEVEKRRAFVAVAARRGILKIERDRAESFGNYVRQLKVLDPTLGIYAAYAYGQVGMIDQVEGVFDWMAMDKEVPVPFDVALLANRLENQTEVRIAGRTPMLTQGWALLHEGLPVSKNLLQASNYTLPSLWTTLSAEGVAFLMEMLNPPAPRGPSEAGL